MIQSTLGAISEEAKAGHLVYEAHLMNVVNDFKLIEVGGSYPTSGLLSEAAAHTKVRFLVPAHTVFNPTNETQKYGYVLPGALSSASLRKLKQFQKGTGLYVEYLFVDPSSGYTHPWAEVRG